ncbi:hypothetical protein [Vreelandella populi]|uniref:Uncharacterized protein n=1 Tax=Vreelandella populi TaxID=2498858 RepID=A0A3S0X2P7_9GAMM|nr:hypothetical protein [Halomonas populi]RUR35601.1 hypothetical protein ELY25_16570 [Halomonas populi]RUR47792.1 hypothetical protein ELY37_05925 [Halomonas populi]
MKILPKPAYFAGLKGLKALILVTGLGLAVCTWYVFFHRLHDASHVTWFPAAAQCDLNTQACSASLGDEGRLFFHIDVSGPIRALAPLPLAVDIEGFTPSQVSVDFVSQNKPDDVYRFVLDTITPGHFRGHGRLGEDRSSAAPAVMPWRARVILETPKGRLGSWFDFNLLSS